MVYQWTKDLETGNSLIDTQHKQLIDAINRLLDACSKGQGRSQIEKTLQFLNDYVAKHFSDEEKLQQQYQYPEYNTHRRYHEGFKKVVQDIITDYQSGGATIPLVAKVNSKIADWLINHIKREDAKVAAHIRSVKG